MHTWLEKPYQSRIGLSRALTSTLLKIVGSSWQRAEKKMDKRRRRALNILQKSWENVPGDYLLKELQESLKQFSLCWRIKLSK